MSEHTVHNSSLKPASRFPGNKRERSRTSAVFHPAAFSLVELALALGIVSFAFIGIFGLIPTGLNTFHQAMDASIGSQIAQRVITDVQQTDFNLLVSSGSAQPFTYQWSLYNRTTSTSVKSYTRYFDNQGNEVVPVDSSSLQLQEKQKIIYWVNTLVTPATTMPTGANYASLATVTIQVANNPGNQTLLTDSNTHLWTNGLLPISTYSALVARNNQ
jgi:uncharacterized protein (TIGR02598 family)